MKIANTVASERFFFPWLPRLSVLDRYIISELLWPFIFGIGTFSSLGIAIGSLFDLVRKVSEADISVAIAVKVFFLQLPYFLAYAFPTAVLLASLIAYSRLSSDSELVAMRSCGIGIYRIVLPALLAGFLVTGVTFAFNEAVVPASRYEATVTLKKALNEENDLFREKNITYTEYQKIERPDGKRTSVLARFFYAERFDGKEMTGLTVLDYSRPKLKQVVLAQSAKWVEAEQTWYFYNGTIYLIDANGSYRSIVSFDDHRLPLPRAPLDLAFKGRDYSEMNLFQSIDRLRLIRNSDDTRKIRKLQIRIQQKIAIPFACLAFALVGATLGMKPTRTSKATGFGLSVLVIFSYYLLMSVGDALGLSGLLAPAIAAWLPTLVCGAFGTILLVRAAR